MATYYVDKAVGDNANLGTSEGAGNAWETIDYAMGQVAAGDLVYVKASATYTERADVDTMGTVSSSIIFEGYTTTPGDDGVVTIDGSGTNDYGFGQTAFGAMYYVFKNFRVTGSTGTGFDFSTANDNYMLVNCQSDNNDSLGANGDNNCLFYKCKIFNNGSHGIQMDLHGTFVACEFYGNGGDDIICNNPLVVGCLFHDPTASTSAINIDVGNALHGIINCTFDGENTTGVIGVEQSFSGAVEGAIYNNIFYDLATGVDYITDLDGRCLIAHNLINSNTTDYDNCSSLEGDVTGAPQFTDEASEDYTLASGSPAVGAGVDAGSL